MRASGQKLVKFCTLTHAAKLVVRWRHTYKEYLCYRGHSKRREKSWDDKDNLRCSDSPGQFILSEKTGHNRD